MPELPPLSDAERENLVAYLDGELDEESARALEAKLQLDPLARTEAEMMQRAWDMLDYLPRAEASASFTNKTLDRVSALRPASRTSQPSRIGRRAWAVGVTWAAALLVAVWGGFASVAHRQPPAPQPEPSLATDPLLVRDLRVIENRRLYEMGVDVEFVRRLESPELFGDENY